MTFFLEKNFEIDNDLTIHSQSLYNWPCVRPCDWDYKKCLDFYARKTKKNEQLILLGAKAIYDDKWQFHYKTLEEWLIKLSLEDNIIPDFEEHVLVIDKYNYEYKTYVMKIIDLHTGKTIEDNTETILKMI